MARTPGSARQLVADFVADLTSWTKPVQQAGDQVKDMSGDVDSATDKIAHAFDKPGDAADDMAQQVRQATAEVDRALQSTSGDVDELARNIEQSYDRGAAAAKAGSRKIADASDVTEDMEHGKESFKEAGSEAGNEFAQNLSQAISSGDYSTLGSDVFGGLVGGFSQMGGALALPLAGAAGVIGAWFAARQAEAERAATAINNAFQTQFDKLTEGLQQSLWGSTVQGAITDLTGNFGQSMTLLRTQAEKAGVPFQDILNQLFQGPSAADKLDQHLQGVSDQWTQAYAHDPYNPALRSAAGNADALATSVDKVVDPSAKGAANAQAMADAMIIAAQQSDNMRKAFEGAARAAPQIQAAAASRDLAQTSGERR